MFPLVSIVIPLFNMKDYINRSVESAISQTYKNTEIILVDDGSTDQTGEICDNLERTYSNIKVVHKENGGPVAARRFGLEISRGEYIIPLDADDWIEQDMVETMVTFMMGNDIDFAQCGLVWEHADGRKIQNEDVLTEGIYDLSDLNCPIYKNLFVGFGIGGKDGVRLNICSCVFKRDIFFYSQMFVPDGLFNGDDDACFFTAILRSKRFFKCNRPFYHSLVRRNSVSRSSKKFFVDQVFMINKSVRPVIETHFLAERLLPRFNYYLLKLFNTYFKRIWGVGYQQLYLFESQSLPGQSRIIIYGAGVVGQAYYSQLKKKFDIVAWIDQRRKNVNTVPIQPVEAIVNLQYDYIILAALKEVTAVDMREELMKINIPSSKIIWQKPILSEGEFFIVNNS